jgi:hypothetical protein
MYQDRSLRETTNTSELMFRTPILDNIRLYSEQEAARLTAVALTVMRRLGVHCGVTPDRLPDAYIFNYVLTPRLVAAQHRTIASSESAFAETVVSVDLLLSR